MGVVFRVFDCHLKISLALGGALQVDDCHVTAHTGSGHVAVRRASVCVQNGRGRMKNREGGRPMGGRQSET